MGLASATGKIDRNGDVIARGAFRDTISKFLGSGFITFGHEWDEPPIAYPVGAGEGSDGLKIVGQFHDSKAAAETRKVLADRLLNGLECGLSVGIRIEKSNTKEFLSGESLAKFGRKQGCLNLEWLPEIVAWQGSCRLITKISELFEVSLVAVPMNPGSRVIQLL